MKWLLWRLLVRYYVFKYLKAINGGPFTLSELSAATNGTLREVDWALRSLWRIGYITPTVSTGHSSALRYRILA